MKQKQTRLASEEEMRIIYDELTPEEIFILGFLKGFNRENTRMWIEMELSIFGNDLHY